MWPESWTIAPDCLRLTLRLWNHRLQFLLRRTGNDLCNVFMRLESAWAVEVSALVVALLHLFGHIAAGLGMCRTFAEGAVHHDAFPPSRALRCWLILPASFLRRARCSNVPYSVVKISAVISVSECAKEWRSSNHQANCFIKPRTECSALLWFPQMNHNVTIPLKIVPENGVSGRHRQLFGLTDQLKWYLPLVMVPEQFRVSRYKKGNFLAGEISIKTLTLRGT